MTFKDDYEHIIEAMVNGDAYDDLSEWSRVELIDALTTAVALLQEAGVEPDHLEGRPYFIGS